jgi:hypothetical protein
VGLALVKYAFAPSGAMSALLAFLLYLDDGWQLLLPNSKGGSPATMIFLAFWVGLVAAPGYFRGCWLVAHGVSVRPLQGCWVFVSIVAGLVLSLVGGLMSLFTIVLGIAGFAAAGSAMWLLKDFLPLVKRATPLASETPPNL